jgi:hypothetical protein
MTSTKYKPPYGRAVMHVGARQDRHAEEREGDRVRERKRKRRREHTRGKGADKIILL